MLSATLEAKGFQTEQKHIPDSKELLQTEIEKSLHSNVLKIPFTQIALELNSSREVISRLMKKLADKGQVKLHKNQIEIIQLPI